MQVYSEDSDKYVDVTKMYNIILLLLFIGNCITILSGCLRICGSECNGYSNCLGYGGLVTFAGFIMLHVFRFGNPGKFCSGDYTHDKEANAPLWSKGNYLFGYMVYMWVLIGLGCLCCLGFTCGFFIHSFLKKD